MENAKQKGGHSGVRQVASAAGVSVATVSRVFNQPDGVRPATRDKVLAAAASLNYVPNSAARSLTMNRSFTIGVVIPTLDNSLFARFIDALEQALAAEGYSLIVATCGFERSCEKQRVQDLLKMGIEGLILSGAEHDPTLLALIEARGLPMVFTSLYDPDSQWPTIGYDNYGMGWAVAEHLYQLGHRQLRILCGPRQWIDRTRYRVQGALDYFAQQGISAEVDEVPISYAAADARVQQLFSQLDFSALLCTSDVLAMAALLAAQRQQIAVPEQLSISGFDDQDWAPLSHPPLTSVHTPSRRMGEATAKALLDCLERETAISSQLIDSHLVVRKSTANVNH